MRVKATISVEKGNGYFFKLNESVPEGFPKDFKINFDKFNYYFGGEELFFKVEDSKIESIIWKTDDDNFEATFNGDFYFEISDEQYEDFDLANDVEGVDYTINISSKDKKIKLYNYDD